MLEGEVALVTGASRGIGAAIAGELGQLGATVIGTATTEPGAAAISETFEKLNVAGRGALLDVGSQTSVDDLMSAMKTAATVPSILVNNAGITRDNLLLRMKQEEWQDVININLNALYRTCRACLRGMMKARRGRIVNITSVVGIMGNPGQANYAAAKAGIIGFTRALAREVGSRGITVNAIAPGFIKTDMTDAMSEEQRAALEAQIPLERLGEAEDIAKAVAFLASPGASYITGEILNINGGMYMS